MSGNPRKFSEKIAIHQRKLNEEQDAFASIIAEVSSITRTGDPMVGQPSQWGPGPSASNYFVPGGGDAAAGQRIPIGHAGGRSPGASGAGGHGHHSHTYHPYRNVSPHQVSPGGTLQTSHSMERPQLTPPYPGAHMFLVPPQDTSWRRTHSDPGIHASVMQPTLPGVQPNAHPAVARTPSHNSASPSRSPAGDKGSSGYYLEPKVNSPQYRPRSCDNVPNISVHPSEPVAGPQVPISTNTGSLPDLPSSLVPAQAHIQHLQGVLSGQPPVYGQPTSVSSVIGANSGGNPTGTVPSSVHIHQQRHSIQLPVQYTQGSFVSSPVAGSNYLSYGVAGMAYSQSSPYYQPESPRSGPNSPNDGGGGGGSDDSPASPQAQAQSPGSPYYSLHTRMQNVNIDSQEPLGMPLQNAYYGVMAPPQEVNSNLPSSAYQQYSGASVQQASGPQDKQQMYQALLLGQQSSRQFPPGVIPPPLVRAGQVQIPLASPSSGQIPDIVFTGTDGSTTAGGVVPNLNPPSGYIYPTMEMLSSDLRVSLDPADLESLHGLNSESGLNIDAASEDALRRDRM